MISLARILVILSGLWLVGLAAATALAPDRAAKFLERFASTARAHYTEQALRLVAGVAILVYAPEMRLPDLFRLCGWVVAGTAVGLLLVPWRWHHRFGRWAIPLAVRHLRLLGLGALLLGAAILWASF